MKNSIMKKYSTVSPGLVSFLSTVIVGYCVHLFAFTNLIPNIDGLSRIYDEQNMLMSGRWFLHFASAFHGFIEAPALIGALSLLFLGASAVMITDLLEIRTLAGGVFTGAFLVVNIAWAYTYTFIFTASAYALSILLAILAVWLVYRTRHGWITGGIVLAFSMGIYQSYISAALALAVLVFLLQVRENNRRRFLSCGREKNDDGGNEDGGGDDTRNVTDGLDGNDARNRNAAWNRQAVSNGGWFLRLAGMFILGVLLYVIILEVCLAATGTQLSNYRGMNSFAEGISVHSVLYQIGYVYADFFRYLFSHANIQLHGTWWIVLNVLNGVLIAWGLASEVRKARQCRKSRPDWLWTVAALLFFPLAVNFTTFMNPSSMWMRFAFCFYYIFAVWLADRRLQPGGTEIETEPEKKPAMHCLTAALLLAVLLFHAQYANTVYTALDLSHKATQSFLTTMVARIQGTAGYRSDMEVVIIGHPDPELYQNGVPELKLIKTSASNADNVLNSTKHIYYYLNDWLGVHWTQPTEEEFQTVSDSAAFQQMPIYPDDGSVKIEDDKVIVKLSDHYTPKKAYELQFEQIQGQGPWRE